jgi:hypothetical protein
MRFDSFCPDGCGPMRDPRNFFSASLANSAVKIVFGEPVLCRPAGAQRFFQTQPWVARYALTHG